MRFSEKPFQVMARVSAAAIGVLVFNMPRSVQPDEKPNANFYLAGEGDEKFPLAIKVKPRVGGAPSEDDLPEPGKVYLVKLTYEEGRAINGPNSETDWHSRDRYIVYLYPPKVGGQEAAGELHIIQHELDEEVEIFPEPPYRRTHAGTDRKVTFWVAATGVRYRVGTLKVTDRVIVNAACVVDLAGLAQEMRPGSVAITLEQKFEYTHHRKDGTNQPRSIPVVVYDRREDRLTSHGRAELIERTFRTPLGTEVRRFRFINLRDLSREERQELGDDSPQYLLCSDGLIDTYAAEQNAA